MMTKTTFVPPEGGLEALIKRAGSNSRGIPPVEKWNPPFCGDLDMRIAADGLWYYMGSPIGREPLVKLFASVVRRDEDGRYYLVTPVEKIGITVEDVPFIGVELHASGSGRQQQLTVRTNVGDIVEVGPQNPLRFVNDAENDGLKPYVLVRGRLEARLARPLLYELAALGEVISLDGGDWVGVFASGTFYPIMLAEELERLQDMD